MKIYSFRFMFKVLIVLFFIIFVGCGKSDNTEKNQLINIIGKKQIYVFETTKLYVNNEHIMNDIQWESLTGAIVTVDINGNIKGKAEGIGVIKASLKSDKNIYTYFEVEVITRKEELSINEFLFICDSTINRFQDYSIDGVVGISNTFNDDVLIGPGIDGYFNLIIRNLSAYKRNVIVSFEEIYNPNKFPFVYSLDDTVYTDDLSELTSKFMLTEHDNEKIITIYWKWVGENTDNTNYIGNLPFVSCVVNFKK